MGKGKVNEIEKIINSGFWNGQNSKNISSNDKQLRRKLRAFGKRCYWKGRAHESVDRTCRNKKVCEEQTRWVKENLGFKP